MATKFHMGLGSVFSISVDGGTTFIPVKQLKTVTFSGAKTDVEDITNMDSVDGVREKAPTLTDPGTGALQGVFLDSDPGQLAINAALVSKILLSCKLQMATRAGQATGFMRTFSAYVTEGDNLDAQFDKSATFSATVTITGTITDTAGTLTV